MKRNWVLALLACAALASPAYADSFVNGNFETGDATGWTTGTGYRGSVLNNALTASSVLPGGAFYNANLNHSSIVTPGPDTNTGNQLNQVYSGNYSWRVEDTTYGGYASAISQQVNNYTDPDIFFAWAAVLEGAHGTNDAATIKIFLTDLTTNTVLITREYNAASSGGGVDARFNYNPSTNFYWTPWQIEQLNIGPNLAGHNFLLQILASDCQPTGHAGYLYLDGFGSVAPPVTPEPATLALFGLGLLGFARRRHS